MSERHLIIYCDESSEKGRYFSHFYGGALLESNDRQKIEDALRLAKDNNNLFAELKWTKITFSYKEKYISFIKVFFDLIAAGNIKHRIMFTQNSNTPTGLEEYQIGNQYWLLYYQLVKHAFGLIYCGAHQSTMVSLYLDDVPDTKAKFDQFANYVSSLNQFPKFISQRVYIPISEITDVSSKDHVILQGLAS